MEGEREREKRLRRRREQYRARRDRESEEERQARLARRREYERRRYAAMTTEQRRNLTQRRRERASQRDRQISFASDTLQPAGELVDNQYRSCEVPSFDHPSVVHKITEFHNSLMSLTPVKCTVCLENFPTLKINNDGICTRCHEDKHSPKLYSAHNNMDPGPVPPELKVSY